MSVFITKPISGIRIEGHELDLRPKEAMSGTYEAPTEMRYEIQVKNLPSNINDRIVLKGKPISGRIWKDEEERMSSKIVHYKPSVAESNTRRARIKQVRDFVKERKAEIQEKVLRAREQRKENKKRKETNMAKGQTYQVIKDTKKLKKWSKKAHKQLMKMPKDMFEDYLKTTHQKHREANN